MGLDSPDLQNPSLFALTHRNCLRNSSFPNEQLAQMHLFAALRSSLSSPAQSFLQLTDNRRYAALGQSRQPCLFSLPERVQQKLYHHRTTGKIGQNSGRRDQHLQELAPFQKFSDPRVKYDQSEFSLKTRMHSDHH